MWSNLDAQGYEDARKPTRLLPRYDGAAIEEDQRLAAQCLKRKYKNCGGRDRAVPTVKERLAMRVLPAIIVVLIVA